MPATRRALLKGALAIPIAVIIQYPTPEGRRIKLKEGNLFLPSALKPTDDTVPLLLHLHGALNCTEPVPEKSGRNCAVLSFNRNGLSKVYTDAFKDPKSFPYLLEEATAELRRAFENEKLKIGYLVLSSFSAGFGGVREILAQPENAERPDAILMCDSIYAGFTGDPAERKVDPANMAGFLKYAKLAVDGKRRMLITYTQLHTPTYASTSETARYLVAQLGGTEEPIEAEWAPKLKQSSRFAKGNLQICGFSGDQGEDHMQHLRNLHVLVKRLMAAA